MLNTGILRKTRSDGIPSDIIIHHHLHLVSVQYITETGGGQEKTKKLEISVAVVCTSVKILKIRRMVNKMGGGGGRHLKVTWVYLPHSKLEGDEGGTTSFYLLSLKS